jgi:phosphomannomutase/phosphoglucomutase
MNAILEKLSFNDATVTDIDGLRVDFSNGWGLVRASNTTASLTLRFEADDEAALESIKNQFREQLAGIDAGLQF